MSIFAGKLINIPLALGATSLASLGLGANYLGRVQAKNNLLNELGGKPYDPDMTPEQMSFRLNHADVYGVPPEDQFSKEQLAAMQIASYMNTGVLTPEDVKMLSGV